MVVGNVLDRLAKPSPLSSTSFWWAEGPGGQEGLQRVLLVNTRHMLSTGLSLALKKNSFCFETLSHVVKVGLILAVSVKLTKPQSQTPNTGLHLRIPHAKEVSIISDCRKQS